MSEQLELIITALIVAMLAFAVYRSGRANPQSTGDLSDKMSKIDARLVKVESSIEDLPTVKDVEGLRGDVKAVKASISHISETVKGTDAAIIRVEQHLLGQTLNGPAGGRRR